MGLAQEKATEREVEQNMGEAPEVSRWKPHVKISAGQEAKLKGLFALCSDDNLRPHLCGIWVERSEGGKATAMATNGAVLGHLELNCEEVEFDALANGFEQVLIPARECAGHMTKAQWQKRVLDLAKEGFTIEIDTASASHLTRYSSELQSVLSNPQDNLQCPNWRQVVPKRGRDYDRGESIFFDPRLLSLYFNARYGKSKWELLGYHDAVGVLLDVGGNRAEGMVFGDHTDDTFEGVIMPKLDKR